MSNGGGAESAAAPPPIRRPPPGILFFSPPSSLRTMCLCRNADRTAPLRARPSPTHTPTRPQPPPPTPHSPANDPTPPPLPLIASPHQHAPCQIARRRCIVGDECNNNVTQSALLPPSLPLLIVAALAATVPACRRRERAAQPQQPKPSACTFPHKQSCLDGHARHRNPKRGLPGQPMTPLGVGSGFCNYSYSYSYSSLCYCSFCCLRLNYGALLLRHAKAVRAAVWRCRRQRS